MPPSVLCNPVDDFVQWAIRNHALLLQRARQSPSTEGAAVANLLRCLRQTCSSDEQRYYNMLYALLVERYRAPRSEEMLLLSGVWNSVSTALHAELTPDADATLVTSLCAGCGVRCASAVCALCELGFRAAAIRAGRPATCIPRPTPAKKARASVLGRPKKALLVKQQCADKILSGGKTWDVRGRRTTVRGRIHLAQAGTGTLVGEVTITDCIPVTMAMLARRAKEHRIASVRCVVAKYRRIYAWVLVDAVCYPSPIAYRHPPGAVTWVRTGDLGCAFRGRGGYKVRVAARPRRRGASDVPAL